MISQSNKSGLRNPWVWGMLGLITVVLAVNSIFIWFATKNTRSTLVERDYQTKSRQSNEEMLQELRQQHALSWQTEINRPDSITVGIPATYEIVVKDAQGQPVSGIMDVQAYRASDASKDFTTTFKEVAPGHYQGNIAFTLKGYWELHIHVQRGEERFNANTDKFMVAAAS